MKNDIKEKDFQLLINAIGYKTDIVISIYSLLGEFIAGENLTTTIDTNVDGVVQRKEYNDTLFNFKYKNVDYIGRIEGASDVEKNYANLIKAVAENIFTANVDISKSDFYRGVLYGELGYSQIQRYVSKFSIEKVPCFVAIINVDKRKIKEVIESVKSFITEQDCILELFDSGLALVKYIDKQSAEYRSNTDYASYLYQYIFEELGIKSKIFVGSTVKSVYDLATSYAQAMTAERMAKSLDSKGNIHTYKEYLLIKMLEDLPKYKLNEYLNTLLEANAKEVLTDEEMISTAEEFLENSLNSSETSRKLYLHRNTLAYRLEKIEKATGLDLRKFSDAVTFRLITILEQLVK